MSDLTGNVHDNLVYVFGGYPNQTLKALNASSGAEVWSYNYGSGYASSVTPVLANGKLYQIQQRWNGSNVVAYLDVFDAANGGSPLRFSIPAVDGDYVFMSMANGVIYAGQTQYEGYPLVRAFDAATGVHLWDSPDQGDNIFSIAIGDGRIYVNGGSGSDIPTAGYLMAYYHRTVTDIDTDIDVTYISRSPRINYSDQPNTPQPGDIVTWTAHIRNRGNQSLSDVDYKWEIFDIDGIVHTITGSIDDLPAGEEVEVDLGRCYSGYDYILFTADPNNTVNELSEQNNSRGVHADALMLGFWVEQTLYDFFDNHQYDFQDQFSIDDGANSWEDWAQRQVRKWNEMFVTAVYPSATHGGLDRVRIDQVIVVPDGSLPLNGGEPTNHPDTSDQTVDMMWGFPATLLYNINDGSGAFNIEPSLIHEMNHARFLVDTYGLNVHGKQIDVRDDAGNRIFPNSDDVIHDSSAGDGIMGGKMMLNYAEWEIDWLNVYAKQRPLSGWANFNSHFGGTEYMVLTQAYPANNIIKVLDKYGNPLQGAEVLVFQAGDSPGGSGGYDKLIDNIPETTEITDVNGEVALGSTPFSLSDIDGGNFFKCVNFIKIRYAGQEFHDWFDLPMVHVNYFRGNTGNAYYNIQIDVEPSTPDVINQKLQNVIQTINDLPASVFTNRNYARTLINKINAVIDKVNNGEYLDAHNKLRNDILTKIDGCSAQDVPDKNDWIIDCNPQIQVYELIDEAIQLLSEAAPK